MMALSHFVIFSALFAAAFADVVEFSSCRNEPTQQCTITGVRITPCKEGARTLCVLKKGQDASISFDFTPNFVASRLKTEVSWRGTRFAGMGNDDACSMTTCPTVSGVSQTLEYNLHLGKRLPSGIYDIMWKVWNEDNAQQLCCFMTDIQLKI